MQHLENLCAADARPGRCLRDNARMRRWWHPRLVSFLLGLALLALGTHWVLEFGFGSLVSEPVVATAAGDPAPRTQALDTEPLARLFGGSSSPRTGNVALVGIVAGGALDRDVALVSVDGAPAVMAGVGDTLPDGALIVEVRGYGIVVRRGDAVQEILLPVPPSPGIERVP
jgi:general secretion pathway protein C